MSNKSHLMPTEAEKAIMDATLSKVHQIALESIPCHMPDHRVMWSWDLSTTAGNVRWKSRHDRRPVVRLSGVIFLYQLRERPLQEFMARMLEVMIHEMCHVACGTDEHHGSRWKSLMRRSGLRPSRTHNMPTIEEVVPEKWRRLVPLGEKVYFTAEGELRYGRVRWYNAKTVTIEDELNYPQWYMRGRFRIPWEELEENINGVKTLLSWALSDTPEVCVGCQRQGGEKESGVYSICSECKVAD